MMARHGPLLVLMTALSCAAADSATAAGGRSGAPVPTGQNPVFSDPLNQPITPSRPLIQPYTPSYPSYQIRPTQQPRYPSRQQRR
ncbi:hypothetical protein ACQR1I_30875 [Bradyrhizobium sp. HKCCYLS2038]|uniref:hypothetical protein n=1 Tax=unclassified Bradyrhizobium TaxID=2631580 RepID=UPI003EBA1CCC